ncbi:hypothetical protein EST38_g3845 [Candolleomyces aberdarensis]|uniref:Uncharacterized protein n=1 Tax=Candolleomyces aberdarensis TaxID=2316362 RepID=A0A4Q2DPJ8_9AGAR|nr:hypothetical protein EST38_g3845 [Candolleomyces aberdarensis]
MHVTSILNANNRSPASIPVSVFDYEGRRKFVVKSNSYEETVGSVKKAFTIAKETGIVFSTASLDVCRGQHVEIDEQAYPHLWDVLDEIIVGTPGNDAPGALTPAMTPLTVTQSKGKKRSSMAANRSSIRSGRPSRVNQVNAGAPVISLKDSPVKPVEVEHPVIDDGFIPEDNRMQPGEPELSVQPDPEPAGSSKVKAGPSIDSLFDDDEVEDYGVPKPDLPEEDEPPSTPSPVVRKARTVTSIQRDPTPEPVIKAEKPADTKKSKFKPAAAVPSGPSASAAVPPASTATTTKQSRTKASAKETVDENARFSIVIHGPGDDISAQFKMRGKHPIHKILKTACTNFGLPYERATLYLMVETDDGEEPDFQELAGDKTALQCGITEGASLAIGIEGDQEEEYEEEEDDE